MSTIEPSGEKGAVFSKAEGHDDLTEIKNKRWCNGDFLLSGYAMENWSLPTISHTRDGRRQGPEILNLPDFRDLRRLRIPREFGHRFARVERVVLKG
jgi:hypothetical protein